MLHLPLKISLLKFLFRLRLTHLSTFLISISTSPCLWTHSSLPYHLTPSISKPPIHSTSPQFSYSWCCMMMIILLLSPSHFSFESFKQDIFQTFRWNNVQYFQGIRSHVYVCAIPGGARVLILITQCTCTEVVPHLKPHCSYRKGWQYQRTAAPYHRRYTVHRTHCACAQQSNVTWNRRGTVRTT